MIEEKSLNFYLNDILYCLSLNIRSIVMKISSSNLNKIEEIRIRVNKPLMITTCDVDYYLNCNGQFVSTQRNLYIPTLDDIIQTIELMSDNSIYAYQEELRNGFLTLKGGHRVGITGKAICKNGEITTMKDISGINIRIAREINGCSNLLIDKLIFKKSIYHTLIISPPNCGKTTLLRDIIRQISNGIDWLGFKGAKVGIVDERSEIAACYKGIPQNDIGIRSDVLDSCPKSQGIIMLVRSMSPNVIATDELGTDADIKAIEIALSAGIKIITTAHAGDINELSIRPKIGKLFNEGLFERIVILSNSRGVGTIEDVIDGHTLKSVWREKNVC